jgi:hypothetical protein
MIDTGHDPKLPPEGNAQSHCLSVAMAKKRNPLANRVVPASSKQRRGRSSLGNRFAGTFRNGLISAKRFASADRKN